MNLSVVSRQALKTLAQEPIDEQLHVLGKIIRDFEKIPEEASHRLCGDLRAHLGRIRFAAESKPDQVRAALDLLKRVKTFDPRRAKIEEDREREEEAANPGRHEYDPEDRLQQAIVKSRLESKPAADGFEKGLIDLPAAIARVRDRFQTPPQWDDDVLAVALPGATDELLIQLYLDIAYWFRELGGAFESAKYSRDLLPPAAQWIVNALARKSRTIAFPRPNCFSISEEIAFRMI